MTFRIVKSLVYAFTKIKFIDFKKTLFAKYLYSKNYHYISKMNTFIHKL